MHGTSTGPSHSERGSGLPSMDITGTRWGLDNAEAVLKLRALRTNGDLDGYLGFHWQEEHKRNYQSRFANRPHLRVVK